VSDSRSAHDKMKGVSLYSGVQGEKTNDNRNMQGGMFEVCKGGMTYVASTGCLLWMEPHEGARDGWRWCLMSEKADVSSLVVRIKVDFGCGDPRDSVFVVVLTCRCNTKSKMMT